MHGIPERLHHGRHLDRNVRGGAPRVDRGHRDVLGEAAVHVDAEDARVLAHVGIAGAAGQAMVADDVAFACHALAQLELGHPLPPLDHLAHELVSERDRGPDPFLGPTVPAVDVEIGPADSGTLHLEEQLVRPAHRGRHFTNLGARVSLPLHHGAHGAGARCGGGSRGFAGDGRGAHLAASTGRRASPV